MPRAFSDHQRVDIQRRLSQVAREHFARFGYRKTGVGEIAREVGIGKGSVYLFFPSKAELFAAVALDAEAELRERLREEMARPFPSTRARIRRFLEFQMEALRGHPLLSVLTDPAETAALFRELPPDRMVDLRASDDRFFGELAESWSREGAAATWEPAMLGALARAIFSLELQRELIGKESYAAVLELIVDSVSRTLASAPGSSDD